MGIWSFVAKERNPEPIDKFRELIEDFREDFTKTCQDVRMRQDIQLRKLQVLSESQQETLLRFEEILYGIQERLNSQVISSVGSIVDESPDN